MADDKSQTTVMRLETKNTLKIQGFKIYVLAVEHGGMALRIENQRKNVKDHYVEIKRGVRLNPKIIIKLDAINESRVAQVSVKHAPNMMPEILDSRNRVLELTRRKGQQLIVGGGKAVITIKNINNTRCAIWVAHKDTHSERVMVLGEAPIDVLPNVKMNFLGVLAADMNEAGLRIIAPSELNIDRHEVYLSRKYKIDVLHAKNTIRRNYRERDDRRSTG